MKKEIEDRLNNGASVSFLEKNEEGYYSTEGMISVYDAEKNRKMSLKVASAISWDISFQDIKRKYTSEIVLVASYGDYKIISPDPYCIFWELYFKDELIADRETSAWGCFQIAAAHYNKQLCEES